MSNDYTPRKDEAFALPPVPDHPESCIADYWSPYELSAISAYGHACAEAARAPLAEENARLKARLRSVCQTLVSAVGADGPCDAEDAAARTVARVAELEAELSDWRQVRSAVAEIAGHDPNWPDHGNAPLAITASYALRKQESDRLRAEVEALSNRCQQAHDAILSGEDDSEVLARLDFWSAARKGEGSEG